MKRCRVALVVTVAATASAVVVASALKGAAVTVGAVSRLGNAVQGVVMAMKW